MCNNVDKNKIQNTKTANVKLGNNDNIWSYLKKDNLWNYLRESEIVKC